MINVTVSTSPAGLDSTCAESMEYGGDTQGYRFHCSPPARGSYVTVTLTGDNVTLVLCQVFVKTIGELHKLPLNCYLASNPSKFFNFFFFFFLPSQFYTAEKFSTLQERDMCILRHWQRKGFFFFFFFQGWGGGGGKRAMMSPRQSLSSFSFIFSTFLITYFASHSITDLRSEKTCFQVCLLLIYCTNE